MQCRFGGRIAALVLVSFGALGPGPAAGESAAHGASRVPSFSFTQALPAAVADATDLDTRLSSHWLTAPAAADRHNLWVPSTELAGSLFVFAAGMLVDTDFAKVEKPSLHNFVRAFTSPPKKDKDTFVVNYILHPEMGAEMYLLVRNREYGWLTGFVFSTVGSVVWEYVYEGWVEQPSISDLVVTSTVGSLFGEARFQTRKWLSGLPQTLTRDIILIVVDPIEALHRYLWKPSASSVEPAPDLRADWNPLGPSVGICLRF